MYESRRPGVLGNAFSVSTLGAGMATLEARRESAAETAESTPEPSRALRRRVLLSLLFAGLLGLMLRMGPHTLTETFPNLGDSVFLAWSISWTGHALATNPLHLFDANIYWPHALSLAYADNLVVALPVFGLVRALGGSWALALNVVLLSALFLSLAATYSLARWLTGRTDASILAAVAFTFGAFTLEHIGHTQLMLLGFFPLAFLLLFRYLEQRSTASALLFGAITVAMAMGALYYFAIYVVCIGVIIVGYICARRLRPGPGFVSGLLIIGAVSLLAIPFLWGYYRLGLTRPLDLASGLKPGDLVTPVEGSILYRGLDSWASGKSWRGEHTLFPGAAAAILAAIGATTLVLSVVRRRAPGGVSRAGSYGTIESRRIFLWLLLLAGGIAGVVALGPEVHGITMPFTYLHDSVPGFGGIRVPQRLAVPGLLAIAVLAAVGFGGATSRLRPPIKTVLAFALGAFMLLEFAAPFTHTNLPDNQATLAVYHALTRKPAGAVVELPVTDAERQGGLGWAYVEAPRMLYSTIDWHPRFNGYSGSWPTGYLENAAALNTLPAPDAIAAIHRLGIRYAVLHTGVYSGVQQYTEEQARQVIAGLPAGAIATRHGNSWLIDFGKMR